MHPAYSVIFFTTASGAGYGLLFWLAVAHLSGALPTGSWMPITALGAALVLITAGLLSSTAHLGHPERAWRALSQWRSSWLSREGVIAVATYIPSGLLALIWLFDVETKWGGGLAILSAAGAVATVYCTGMIYASLRTIRQWNHPLVPVNYLAMAATSGLLLLALFLIISDAPSGAAMWGTVILLCITAVLKYAYFHAIDADDGQFTDGMALGLGTDVAVRQLDPPHTRPNFVMREMGYSIGRKHAARLRKISFVTLFLCPVILMLLAAATGTWPALICMVAVMSMAIGLIVERWLFFAEATHVSMLYYGLKRA